MGFLKSKFFVKKKVGVTYKLSCFESRCGKLYYCALLFFGLLMYFVARFWLNNQVFHKKTKGVPII